MKRIAFLLSLFVWLMNSSVSAQPFVFLEKRSPLDLRENLALKKISAEVEVNRHIAVVSLEQELHNTGNTILEGTYFLPLPINATVEKFSIRIDDKEIAGEVLSSDEARKIYLGKVRDFYDPALLEYDNHQLLKLRLFPFPPNESREITVRYTCELERLGDMFKLSFPLQRVGNEKSSETVINVSLWESYPITNIYSPTHLIDVDYPDEEKAVISYEGKDHTEQFILFYGLEQKDGIGMDLLAFKERDEGGYFLLLITPPVFQESSNIKRDFIFILDKSGSMSGDKIRQAKEAFTYCLSHLEPEDRFSIISYSSRISLFKERLVPIDEYRQDSIDYVEEIEAGGGTNINDALIQAMELVKESKKRPTYIIFLTDGLPTVGETDLGHIVKNVKSLASENIRLFVFGVGYDVNTNLLDLLAKNHRGTADYIEPEQEIDESITSFYQKIAHPALVDVEIDFGGFETEEVFPVNYPDLFAGTKLSILGRYAEGGKARIKLSGRIGEKLHVYKSRFDFPRYHKKLDFLRILWASRKVGYLMEEIRLNGSNPELVKEVKKLGMEYGILTPYTSFLVEEEETPLTFDRRRPHHFQSPIPSPQIQILNKGSAGKSSAVDMALSGSGLYSVKMSIQTRTMKEAVTLGSKQKYTPVKAAGKQNFYLINNRWTTIEYLGDEKEQLEQIIRFIYLSDAYFQLIQEFPEMKKYLAIGEKVVFRWGKIFVEIGDTGEEKLTDEVLKLLKNNHI